MSTSGSGSIQLVREENTWIRHGFINWAPGFPQSNPSVTRACLMVTSGKWESRERGGSGDLSYLCEYEFTGQG